MTPSVRQSGSDQDNGELPMQTLILCGTFLTTVELLCYAAFFQGSMLQNSDSA
jgi:hypothetical protein